MPTLPSVSPSGTSCGSVRRPLVTAALVALFAATGCGRSKQAASAHTPTTDTTEVAASGGLRVPLHPTAPGELPAAILGKAGPLEGMPVRYLPGDTLTVGYLAVPSGAGPFPALVIIHEWNGLVDRVRHTADALAAEGYETLAVDLYDGRTGSTPDEDRALMAAALAGQPKMIANLNAAVAYLKSRPEVSGRIGAIGWCFGGGVALTFALHGVPHDATAIFYGPLVDDASELAHIEHEVYGTFAGLDRSIPPAEVTKFEAGLRRAGVPYDIRDYDGVNHAFWLHVDQAPERRTAAALDAWQRLKAYLKRTLGSRGTTG
jgi:carboxymethylenebutenolidase